MQARKKSTEVSANRPAKDPEGVEALKIAGHDLKTPLTSLRMLAQVFQMALDRGTLATQPERTARNCQMLINQVDKLAALTDDLLDVSRVFSGRLKIERSFSDLRPVLQAALPEARRLNEALKEPLMGEWDGGRMRQAFCEISKSIAEPVVDLELRPDEIRVRFSGKSGILGELDSSVPGLYIAKAIIEKHDGHITHTPNSCTVVLPRARVAATQVPATPNSR